jgi:hypothetical protein
MEGSIFLVLIGNVKLFCYTTMTLVLCMCLLLYPLLPNPRSRSTVQTREIETAISIVFLKKQVKTLVFCTFLCVPESTWNQDTCLFVSNLFQPLSLLLPYPRSCQAHEGSAKLPPFLSLLCIFPRFCIFLVLASPLVGFTVRFSFFILVGGPESVRP